MVERDPSGAFVSGRRHSGSRLGRFLRSYRVPLAVTLVFGVVLAATALTSEAPPVAEPQPTTNPARSTGPRTTPCVACPLAHTCDPVTGRCVLIDRKEPVDCVGGATYDEEQGFCVPPPTPRPTRTPVPFATPQPPGAARPATPESPATPSAQTPSASTPLPGSPEPSPGG